MLIQIINVQTQEWKFKALSQHKHQLSQTNAVTIRVPNKISRTPLFHIRQVLGKVKVHFCVN